MFYWRFSLFSSIYGEKTEGYDCGDEAADWFAEFLELPGVRLIYSGDGVQKREMKHSKLEVRRELARDHDVVCARVSSNQLSFRSRCVIIILLRT